MKKKRYAKYKSGAKALGCIEPSVERRSQN